jgi:hypothetical protein
MLRFLYHIRDMLPFIVRRQKLLAMYRSLLAEHLRQRQQWQPTEVPGFLNTGIIVLRGHILKVKGTLRGWGIVVADHPDGEVVTDDFAFRRTL